jgi:hypothetical protein
MKRMSEKIIPLFFPGSLFISNIIVLRLLESTFRPYSRDSESVLCSRSKSCSSLKRREKALRDNCEILEKRTSEDRQVLRLLEQIRSMGISVEELLTVSVAVNEKAQKANLSISAVR